MESKREFGREDDGDGGKGEEGGLEEKARDREERRGEGGGKDDSARGAEPIEQEDEDAEEDGSDILDKVQEYFFSPDFARIFESFLEDNCHIIDVDSEENKLEYTEVYNRYRSLFESSIEEYITSQGVTVVEYYDKLKRATEKDPKSCMKVFSQLMLACSNFDIFMLTMREAREAQLHTQAK